MPLYESSCKVCKRDFEYRSTVANYLDTPECCGQKSEKVIRTAPMGVVQPDIHYTSPIDGSPVTSLQARKEDLARNNCIPYDEEMKTDVLRRQVEVEKETDKAVDKLVEQTAAQLGIN